MRLSYDCDLRVSDGPFQLQNCTPLACFGSRKFITEVYFLWVRTLKSAEKDSPVMEGCMENPAATYKASSTASWATWKSPATGWVWKTRYMVVNWLSSLEVQKHPLNSEVIRGSWKVVSLHCLLISSFFSSPLLLLPLLLLFPLHPLLLLFILLLLPLHLPLSLLFPSLCLFASLVPLHSPSLAAY